MSSLVSPCNYAEDVARSAPILPIASLRTWLGQAGERVSVRGVVTRTGRDSYVQDATGGLLVHFAQPPRIKVGDELEVTGVPGAQAYSARIEDATARVLWAAVPPPPVAITVDQAARGDFDGDFVEIEARLDRVQTWADALSSLYLSNDQQSFVAMLQAARGEFITPHLEPHSMVRLRGICSMDPALTHNQVPFVLLLRSAEDVEELAGPPWWSPQLLLRDFLILLSLTLLGALISVRVRTGRHRAIQQEREHIAHELHDTLAQSFAGVGFQLQAVRSGLPADSGQLSRHVDVAIGMVRHSHQEARRSIAALRTRAAGQPALADELQRSLERMIGDGPVRVQVQLSGPARPLPLRVTDALLRIGQEAGANAISHAEAGSVTVRLMYLENAIMLEVEDDGCGFTASEAASNGLGLSGMAARARKLHGSLEIKSRPGRGTTISTLIPLRERRAWQHWRQV